MSQVNNFHNMDVSRYINRNLKVYNKKKKSNFNFGPPKVNFISCKWRSELHLIFKLQNSIHKLGQCLLIYHDSYQSSALHPRQLSCFFANFMIPPVVGVEIDTALVWFPWRSSLLAFFRIGSNILSNGWPNKQTR